MTTWTISAQKGTGGDHVAAELATAAGVPLLDHCALAALAHDIDPDHLDIEELDEIEERIGGRLRTAALRMAMISGPATGAAFQELELRHKLPTLGRAVLTEAARRPCVILAPAAFAAAREHPAAIHVRLHAPLACRIAAYQHAHLLDHAHARIAIVRDDLLQHAWVRRMYHAELDDDTLFTLSLDTSRFTRERLVNTLLAAGGIRATAAAGTSTHDNTVLDIRRPLQC